VGWLRAIDARPVVAPAVRPEDELRVLRLGPDSPRPDEPRAIDRRAFRPGLSSKPAPAARPADPNRLDPGAAPKDEGFFAAAPPRAHARPVLPIVLGEEGRAGI
jgi:hypothetical protein